MSPSCIKDPTHGIPKGESTSGMRTVLWYLQLPGMNKLVIPVSTFAFRNTKGKSKRKRNDWEILLGNHVCLLPGEHPLFFPQKIVVRKIKIRGNSKKAQHDINFMTCNVRVLKIRETDYIIHYSLVRIFCQTSFVAWYTGTYISDLNFPSVRALLGTEGKKISLSWSKEL